MSRLQRKIEEVENLLKPQSQRTQATRILLGTQSGKPCYLDGKALNNSIHIMGATREGKSKQLENIYRQFIDQGVGGAVIDPHGYLYDDLLAYCSYKSSRTPQILDKLILFDPGDDQHIVGFNTLQRIPGHDIDTLTLSRMYATIKARGKENFDDMPTAKTWLQNIFQPLIEKDLTLIEAKHLIARGASADPATNAIIQNVGVDLVERDWTWYANQSKRTQYEELLSSINMLRNFVTSQRMEFIFGRLRKVLDLREIMDSGKILLVNLSSRKLHQDIARLLGTLLVNELFLVAKTRPPESPPFYLAIDEFENYVTQDIADVLDQGPKFGLHLVLAHHSLEQLRQQNERVYAAVMQNAKIKIIYGGLTYENAETMVKELYSYFGKGGIDPMLVKRMQESPYIEPRETTRKVTSSGTTQSESAAETFSSSSSQAKGESRIPIDSIFLSDELLSYISSDSEQSGRAEQHGSVTAESYTESIVPFIEQQLKWYVSGIQFWSLEEQIYAAVARMKNLPQQMCLVKYPKEPVFGLKTNYVPDIHTLDGELEEFISQVNTTSPYHMSPAEALEERERIHTAILCSTRPSHDEEKEGRWE